MKRTHMVAVALAAGASAAALVVVPAYATAGPSPSPSTNACQSMGPGRGPGAGHGMGFGRGQGAGQCAGQGAQRQKTEPGSCLGLLGTNAPSGTLTGTQKATLAAMAEEEKLAHDLYTDFAARYPSTVFDRIAAAESRHLTAVRTLLGRYDIADPTAGKASGEFAASATAATYQRLLTEGKGSEQAALRAGVSVEKDDVAALEKARAGLAAAPDVERLYARLLDASRAHQAAFERWAA